MSEDTQADADPITQAALEAIQAALPDAVVAHTLEGHHPSIQVTAEALRDVITFLRDDEALRYDCLHLVSGVDWPKAGPDGKGEMEVLYHLVSYTRPTDAAYRARAGKNDGWICIKVRVPRETPEVPSVMDLHTGADWHERETYDLVGIRFTGRDELRRILLPEDWPGHPLQKDWEYPVSYHGVPILPPEAL